MHGQLARDALAAGRVALPAVQGLDIGLTVAGAQRAARRNPLAGAPAAPPTRAPAMTWMTRNLAP